MTWKFALVVLLLGCHAPKGRADARAIVRAYEDFQAASLGDRPAALQALEGAPCMNETCRDRDACATYARHLLRGQTLIQKARELGSVDAGGNGAATETELALIVGGADDATHAAADAEPACRAAIGRLYALTR
ncbi:MAG: hypothetical protein ACXVEF_20445 [Polyangiales bacterium]